MKTSRAAQIELVIIAITALTFAIIELYVDSFQRFVAFAAANETLLVTEIVTLAIVLAVGFTIYSWRRWREVLALESDKAQLQKTMSSEQDARRLIRSYADAVTRGQEAERHRLARELHDDTIQRLIFLNQKVELAAFDHADSAAAADLHDMQVVVDDIIGGVRAFIQELRPTYLDELGLAPALRTLIKNMRETTDLFIEFETVGKQDRLNESTELALYRISQTALNNALQHANATQIQVILEFRDDRTKLTIADDGSGFEPLAEADLVREGHFGLIGMRERAQLLGADFSISSTARKGTTIKVDVPHT